MDWNNTIDANQTGVQSINNGVWTKSSFSQFSLLVGNASNAIVGVTPSAIPGVPVISNGSLANPSFGTAVVAGGGTGVASFIAYAPIIGGTTPTGSLQSAGTGIGSSGYVLTSNGSSATPTFLPVASSITGTANQVLVNGTSGSARTGVLTLTLPQSIATTSIVQFGQLGLGGAASNNTLSITGNASIGYGNTAAPTSGLIVQGASGFGTNSVTNFFRIAPSSLSTYDITANISGTLIGTNSNATKSGLFINTAINPTYVGTIGVATPTLIQPSFAPGSGCTISKAIGCYIPSGSGGGAGTISYGYGLFVNRAGFGTNRRTAYFDPYVGIGAPNPIDVLHVVGTGTALSVTSDTAGTVTRGRFFCTINQVYMDSSTRGMPFHFRTTDSFTITNDNFVIDANGNITVQNNNKNTLTFYNIVNTTGLSTATLTNSPKAGNPVGWIQITVNGTSGRYIPCW